MVIFHCYVSSPEGKQTMMWLPADTSRSCYLGPSPPWSSGGCGHCRKPVCSMAGQHQEAEKSTLAQTTIQTCLELGHQTIHWSMDVYGLSTSAEDIFYVIICYHMLSILPTWITIIRLSMVIHSYPPTDNRPGREFMGIPHDPHDEEHQDAMEALVSEALEICWVANRRSKSFQIYIYI